MNQETEDFFFVRPATQQQIAVGKRQLPNQAEKLFNQAPRVGIVISTFAAAAYIDLALAVRRKFYPEVPVLVHDDASDQTDKLAGVCQDHGVLFESNSARLGHEMGDLSSIVGGLGWAKENGIDLLVKFSRRFIPRVAWLAGLQNLALTTQFSTFGQACHSYRLPLRTECFAMAVEPWSDEKVVGGIADFMLKNRQAIFVETYLLGYARKVHETICVAARNWEAKHVKASPGPVYAGWDFVGTGRAQPSPGYLWHETATPAHYAELATKVGLKYAAQDFAGLNSRVGL